jgi:uncharacterized integral membrane protein (TIGR00698 family)
MEGSREAGQATDVAGPTELAATSLASAREKSRAVDASLAACRRYLPGLWVATVISLAATFVSEHSGGPQLLYALFFGIAFHFLHSQPNCRPGIEFATKTLLRFAIALLGARITFAQVAQLGWWPIAIVGVATPATLVFGVLCARLLGRSRDEGILSGGAVGICGASAALAISAVLPNNKDNERLTLLTVVGVTGLSTLAMILYPTLVQSLRLDPSHAGVFLGGTIHDVAQVVGAGYTVSPQAGDVATFVKLLRVTLLMPVVIVVWLMFRSKARASSWQNAAPPIPFFLIGFSALLIANSTGLMPARLNEGLNLVSRWCLVTAIAALGVKTSFQQLAALGWRPVALLVANTLFLAILVLGLMWCQQHYF